MALITAHSRLPDFSFEHHTITIDTISQTDPSEFTVYLNKPLKNVVQARLSAAHINTTGATEHCYISIKEFDSSMFHDLASMDPPLSPATNPALSAVRGSFASLVTTFPVSAGTASLISHRDEYPILTQYLDPLQRIDRLTIKMFDQTGAKLPVSVPAGNNFLVIDLTCKRANMSGF